jgi:hypothetical protein
MNTPIAIALKKRLRRLVDPDCHPDRICVDNDLRLCGPCRQRVVNFASKLRSEGKQERKNEQGASK